MRVFVAAFLFCICGCSDRQSTSTEQMAVDLKLVRLTILTEVLQGSTKIVDEGLLFDSVKLRTEPSARIWFINTNYTHWNDTALDRPTSHGAATALRLVLNDGSEASQEITFGGQVISSKNKQLSAGLLRVSQR